MSSSKKTPDTLTQAEYRGRGYHVIKVEQWKIQPYVRKTDFLGIFDYMAFNDSDDYIFCIQTTTKHNMEARRKKMLSSVSFPWWVKGRRRAMLHGWYKEKGKWALHEMELTMEHWNKFQAEKKEKESVVDTNSPLYKELFPNG